MRGAAGIAGAMVLFAVACAPASAAADDDLYRARTVVTGQEEPNRSIAFGKCLQDALVKVSGDPGLAADPRVTALAARASTFVSRFDYRDLMAGIPVHDEQGTRERPYELTVSFDPAKVDATLRSLGRKPWTAERPRLVVFLDVHTGTTAYPLTRDGDRGRDMRDALDDAGWRLGVPVELPGRAELTAVGLSPGGLAGAESSRLDAAAKIVGGDIALSGSIRWSDDALGWIADWRLHFRGKGYPWQISGVSFDQAFRAGVAGAAQILSGHGAP